MTVDADKASRRGGKLRVVIVGQTPPPFGGQAVAIRTLLDGQYESLELSHVRMAFSRDIGEIGRAQMRKVLHVPGLVLRVLWRRLQTRGEVLYYPPAASNLIPFVRDVVVLVCCRWAFRWTVFHFHAGGLAEFRERLPRALRPLFRAAYGRPDVVIELPNSGPSEAVLLGARHRAIVANGVPDEARGRMVQGNEVNPRPVVLYVGVLRESKGVLDLIDACGILRAQKVAFEVRLMGECQPPEFEKVIMQRARDAGIEDSMALLGRRTGEDKWREYSAADIFCFPTFFEYETFSLVVLEAMQFELPVVATSWRGVRDIVHEGETGFLVPVNNPCEMAERLGQLLADPELRRRMGSAGRRRYLENFTEQHYRRGFEDAIWQLVS